MNEKQCFFLKKMAALQYPGSTDNVGTRNPLHMVQQVRTFSVWRSINESDTVDDYERCVFFNQNDQQNYASPIALIASVANITSEEFGTDEWQKDVDDFNAKQRGDEPQLVAYDNTYGGTSIYSKDGNLLSYVTDLKEYFEFYFDRFESGVDIDDINIVEEIPYNDDVGAFFILDEAKKYMKYQAHNLNQPRTYTYGEAYGSRGDYADLRDFLMETGTDLLRRESKELIHLSDIEYLKEENHIRIKCKIMTTSAAFGIVEEVPDKEICGDFVCDVLQSYNKSISSFLTSSACAAVVIANADKTAVRFEGATDNFEGYDEVQSLFWPKEGNFMDSIKEFIFKMVNYIRYKQLPTPNHETALPQQGTVL